MNVEIRMWLTDERSKDINPGRRGHAGIPLLGDFIVFRVAKRRS